MSDDPTRSEKLLYAARDGHKSRVAPRSRVVGCRDNGR
jgi:hypothetical protein